MVIAIPLSWKTMQDWLDTFAYSININVLIYCLAGLVVLLLTSVSVAYLSLKAASVNPANVLKDE